MISSPSLLELQGQDAEIVWQLAHGLDLQLGQSQCSGSTVESTMAQVGPWILEKLGARGLGLILTDGLPDSSPDHAHAQRLEPSLDPEQPPTPALNAMDPEAPSDLEVEGLSTFFLGNDRPLLQAVLQQPTASFLSAEGETPVVAAIPITLGNHAIGALALSFDQPPPSPGAIVLLEVIGQELNNLFYEFRRARLRHRQVLELGKRLQNRVLDQAIDAAVTYIFEQTDLTGVMIAYWEDSQDKAPLCLRAYQDGKLQQSSRRGDPTPLGYLFQQSHPPSAENLLQTLQWTGIPIGPIAIDIGLWDRDHQGLVCGVAPLGANPSEHQELLEQLANNLGQRLVDYHKDRRYLQAFFSSSHVSRLLSVADYQQTYLSPRLQNVAMLYTDITSFTTISEQILDTPAEVGTLIDYWSEGVVQILFDYQGVFDKMVGDCIIGLFGTPFSDDSDAVKVARAIQAALAIQAYTTNLTGSLVDKIRQSGLIPGFGVATGVNFGNVMVGTFGPNHDFTAFGQEMNNTARLQGVAGFQEILVMETAYQLLGNIPQDLFGAWRWSDRLEAKVKNVKDPLYFRQVLP
ncbi:MAG: adenylate/guanylate cyclase domain-containing protein [Prochlorotrichaceae cyanobacterium]